MLTHENSIGPWQQQFLLTTLRPTFVGGVPRNPQRTKNFIAYLAHLSTKVNRLDGFAPINVALPSSAIGNFQKTIALFCNPSTWSCMINLFTERHHLLSSENLAEA